MKPLNFISIVSALLHSVCSPNCKLRARGGIELQISQCVLICNCSILPLYKSYLSSAMVCVMRVAFDGNDEGGGLELV